MKAAIGKLTDSWKWVALLLCIFGFFRELRPSEPFAAEFFITWRNVSTEDVTRILYPIGTYSYLAQLVIVFLITDMLRYEQFKFIIELKVIFLFIGLCVCFVQIQIRNYLFGCNRNCLVLIYVVDRNAVRPNDGSILLRFVYGCRSGLLHIYLCKGGPKQIPIGHQLYAFGNIGGTISGQCHCPIVCIVQFDELSPIKLSVTWV